MIGYRAADQATPAQVLAEVEATVARLVAEAMDGPDGAIVAACTRAQAFVRGWWGEPPTPPYAPEDPG